MGTAATLAKPDTTFRQIAILEQAETILAECQSLDEALKVCAMAHGVAETVRVCRKKIDHSQRIMCKALAIRAQRTSHGRAEQSQDRQT